MNLLPVNKALPGLRLTDSFKQIQLCVVIAVFACILFSVACNTTASIADFSKSAQTTLASGVPIFGDFSATCNRELADHKLPGEFSTDKTIAADCQAIANQAKGIEAASGVVSDYFGALNSLASFNTAKTSGDVNQLVSDAGELAQLSVERRDALAALAQIITQIATSSYQAKHLRDDIVKVDPHLQKVIVALQQTVIGPGMYLDMIAKEESALAGRSREFLLLHRNSPESTLFLDRQWKMDSDALAAKERSAKAYVAALTLIGKGHSDLAQQAKTINGKQILAVLTPYIDQIEPLIPTIRNAFN